MTGNSSKRIMWLATTINVKYIYIYKYNLTLIKLQGLMSEEVLFLSVEREVFMRIKNQLKLVLLCA